MPAQSAADAVAARERATGSAIQAGKGISSFYWPSYFGIKADGSSENFEKISNAVEGPVKLDDAFSVRACTVWRRW